METARLLDPDQRAEQTFGQALLRDRRRTRRAVKAACGMVRDPAASLPKQQKAWKAVKAMYRLLEEADGTFEALMHPHWQQTRFRRRSGKHQTVRSPTAVCEMAGPDSLTGKERGRSTPSGQVRNQGAHRRCLE